MRVVIPVIGNTTDKESHITKLEKVFTYYKAASIVRMMESILTKGDLT